MKTTLCTAIITALCTMVSAFAASENTSAWRDCLKSFATPLDHDTRNIDLSKIKRAQVAWNGSLPSSSTDIEETHEEMGICVPTPSPQHASFSRLPLPPYINDINNSLIIEYVLPSLSQDRVITFVVESCRLSDNGKQLTVKRQRIYAPSDNLIKSIFIYKIKTSIPYQFRIGDKYFAFDVKENKIISCKVFQTKSNEQLPTLKRTIYPSEKWQFGIISHI